MSWSASEMEYLIQKPFNNLLTNQSNFSNSRLSMKQTPGLFWKADMLAVEMVIYDTGKMAQVNFSESRGIFVT